MPHPRKKAALLKMATSLPKNGLYAIKMFLVFDIGFVTHLVCLIVIVV